MGVRPPASVVQAALTCADQLSNKSAVCNLSRMAGTRHLLLLVFIFSPISGQINFGGGSSSRPSSSSGGQKPSSSSSSGSGSSSGGSSIQFSSDPQSPKEVVQGLQSKRQTLATVLKSQGVSPAVDVNIRGSLGTRRLGDRCTTPQRTAGSCQYIFASQCRQGDWPWAVVLGTKNTFSNRFSVQCGGTLLDQTTVLTAAHCFDQAGGPNVVRLGDHDINTSSDGAQAVDVSIRRIIQHPGWDSNSLENDICILKLSQPIQYSRDIRRACLPTQYRGQDLPSVLARPQPIVVGWGSTSTGTGLGLAMRMHLPMRIGCASMRIDAHHPHIGQKKKSHFLPINCHFGLDSIAVSLFTNIREYS